MKTLTIILLSLFSLTLPGQQVKQYLKHNAVSLSLCFAGGAFDGFNEVLDFDYPAFKRTFPKANDNFWNPNISWQNKWKNGNLDEGRRFPGSTTIFVWTTDGYHLTKTMTKACITASIVLHIGKKQRWWKYGLDFLTYSVAYSAGFNLTLHGVFGHKY